MADQVGLFPPPAGPRLYLSNFASRESEGHHGPGRLLTIMRAPRAEYGEWGEGRVETFTPPEWMLLRVKSGDMDFDTYVRCLKDLWSMCYWMRPGELGFEKPGQPSPPLALVESGDTLCCCCARGVGCHRWVVADFLLRVGWRVTLDGRDVDRDDVARLLEGPRR